MFKKILCSILLVGLITCGCGKRTSHNDDLATINLRDKLVVGVREDTKPFGFKDQNGIIKGYDIDLAKNIAKQLLGNEAKVEFVPVTASNRIMKLSAKEVDFLLATMSITPQRQQILDFSVPYYMAGQAILVNSSSKATSLKDFQGKRMIIVFGSTSERNLRMNVPEVSVIGYKDYNDAYLALKAGKAEGMIADDTVLMGFALNDSSVKLLPKRYSKEPYAAAFRKDADSQRLQAKINVIIDNMQHTGQLNKLQEKWKIKQ